MKIDLTGKVALVTGAAGGIGRAVVAALLEAGASVVAEDLNPAVRELEQLSPQLVSVQGPVADTTTAQAAVALAEAKFGGIDILINNAGRTFPKALADTTDAEWDSLMADNVKGMFVHAREVLPSLRRRGGGAIVNTSSVSGVVGTTLAYTKEVQALAGQLGRRLRPWQPGPGAPTRTKPRLIP